jgi:two-component system sensor histidine kinase HydH
MVSKKRYYLVAIIASTLLITYLHYSTLPAVQALHDIYRELYYVPVLIAAIAFGLKGGLSAFVFIAAFYLPYIFMSWSGTFLVEANKFLHLVLQGFVAIFAGYLIDRDRRQRQEMERERYLSGIGRAATEIVHDLKNPLIAILGFARRIREGKGRTDTAIQAIISSAEQMQKIVGNVLEFAGPVRLERKEEDIVEVIRRASRLCEIKAEQKGVLIALDLPSATARMPLDSPQMERALANLISNAVEASRQGQSVSISAADNRKSFSITIRDQGPGMDRETLGHVFLPFFTKKNGGTGLGIPIAKKIIEGHNGNIRINSGSEFGTEVVVTLQSNNKRRLAENLGMEPQHN